MYIMGHIGDTVYQYSVGGTNLFNENIEIATGLTTITRCIVTWNADIDPDNTLTVKVSADGTNYEEVTDSVIHNFEHTGTSLYIRFEDDFVDEDAVDLVYEYAIIYNPS